MDRRIKHQLLVHLDFSPPPVRLEIRYSYPFSGSHALGEQLVAFDAADIPPSLRADLDALTESMMARVPLPAEVRLPHASITPTIERAILTLVAQDQAREAAVPLVRLYYYESVAAIRSRIEKQIRAERPELSPNELRMALRVAASVRGIAWRAYAASMAGHLFPD